MLHKALAFGFQAPHAAETPAKAMKLTTYNKPFTPSFAIIGCNRLAVVSRLSRR